MKNLVMIIILSFGLSLSLHGQTPVETNTPPHPTYRVSFSVVCGGSGDCVTLYATTKKVAIRQIYVTKPSAAITVSLFKYSTADTGGTSSSLTPFSLVTGDASPTASATAYTSAPTQGTALGTLLAQAMATTDTLVQTFGTLNDKPLVLQPNTNSTGGSATPEGLIINVNGAATIVGYIEFTEP